MILQEFLEELAFGELMDLSMAEDGEIRPADQPKIVINLNDALLRLYTKYVIRLEQEIIDTSIKALSYSVSSPHAVRIVYAVPNSEDYANQEEYLTDIYRKHDLMRISGRDLTFTKEPKNDQFLVHYQWKPLRLSVNPASMGYLQQRIDMLPELHSLVRTYVASAVFTNMNGEAHKNTGVELFNKAQYIESDLEMSGILRSSVDYQNNTFWKNGFV